MAKARDVSIIIASYKGDRFLTRCIESVLKHTSVSYELFIVGKTKQEYSNKYIKYIRTPINKGPSYSRNSAAKNAKGKYLLFLDNDTQIKGNNFLGKTVKYLDKHPDIGGGQLKLLRSDRTAVFDSAGDLLTPFGFLAERAQSTTDNGKLDTVEPLFSSKGAAMIVRKSVFDSAGGFDKDYFMYWEEPDLIWRIWKSGKQYVFLPMDTVYHAYGTRQKNISRKWENKITYLGCRNHIITMTKNGVGLRGLVMTITVALAWIGLLFLFLVTHQLEKTKAIMCAFWWLLTDIPLLVAKRKLNKQNLGKGFYSDNAWMKNVLDSRGLNWYVGKGLAYITGKPY